MEHNLTGKRSGKLVAIMISKKKSSQGRRLWECLCDCGGKKLVDTYFLRIERIKSCGCFTKEQRISKLKKHGYAPSKNRGKVYRTWLNMRNRCNNKNDLRYFQYGGRGIKVCKRWDNFSLFLKDMGEPPSNEHSIDRKNNEGDYKPSNCQWATRSQQGRNKRNNIFFTFEGKTLSLLDWSEKLNIPYSVLWKRIRYHNWDIERALTQKYGS